MNLFDYFIELEEKRNPRPTQRDRIALGQPPAQSQPVFNPFVAEDAPVQQERIILDPLHPNNDPMAKYGAVTTPTTPTTETDRPVLVQPNQVSQPMDELELAQQRYEDLRNTRPVNNDKGFLGRLGDILRQAVVSGGQGYQLGLKSGMNPTQALAQAGGASLSGGLYGGFHPEVDEERQLMYDTTQAEEDVNKIKLNREWQTNQAAKQAQTENLKRDDEFRVAQTDQKRKDAILSKYQKRKYYDPTKATQAEIAELASIGKKPTDLGSWDDRNPTTLKWGDSVFVWDNNKQAFVDSGMPKDGSKAIVDYTVTYPDGTKKVFQTTSEKAASLAELAEYRNATLELGRKQFEYRKENDAAEREFALKRDEIAQQMKVQLEAFKTANEAAQKEVDANRRRELQTQAENARLKLAKLRDQLKDDK